MQQMTPGQTAHDFYYIALGEYKKTNVMLHYNAIAPSTKESWETAAQAVLAAHAPKPSQMTPLDEFAKAAMQGELAAQTLGSGFWSDANAIAARAYSIAKAMMEEKNANN